MYSVEELHVPSDYGTVPSSIQERLVRDGLNSAAARRELMQGITMGRQVRERATGLVRDLVNFETKPTKKMGRTIMHLSRSYDGAL